MNIDKVILAVRFSKYVSDKMEGDLPCPVTALRKCENKATDTQVYLFQTEQYLVVAFPCTDGMRDALRDLDAKMVERDIAQVHVRAHRGFKTAWDSVKGDVFMGIVAFQEQRELLLAGYSLGGALCTECTTDVGQSTVHFSAVTSGSPRVGNAAYRNEFNKWVSPGQMVRLVHGKDPYTRVPNQEPGMFKGEMYHHVVPETALHKGGITSSPGRRSWWKQALHVVARWASARLRNPINLDNAPDHSINAALEALLELKGKGVTDTMET